MTESTLLQIPAAGKKLLVTFHLCDAIDLIDPIYVDKNSSNPFAWLVERNLLMCKNITKMFGYLLMRQTDIQRRAWATATW